MPWLGEGGKKKNLRPDSLLQWGHRKKLLSFTEVDNSFCSGLLNEALLGFQGRWKSHQGEKNYFLTTEQTVDFVSGLLPAFYSKAN